jgi:hypothetical protein
MALSYGIDDPGFESRHGLGIFLFTTASRSALEPTQPPIQWVPGALPWDNFTPMLPLCEVLSFRYTASQVPDHVLQKKVVYCKMQV